MNGQQRRALNKLVKIVMPYYKEKHRVYHTWTHISHLLYRWHPNEYVRTRLRPYEAYEELAILFHDIVYVPGSYENEEQSILLMKSILANYQFITCNFSAVEIDKAEQIIYDTKYPHIPTHDFSKYVVDMDMLGFCYPYYMFFDHSNKIEKEFKSIPDMKEKRKKFLLHIYNDRNPFYYSDEVNKIHSRVETAKSSLSQKARHNIAKLLESHYGWTQ